MSIKYWQAALCLRVLLVFVPQNGYIHPDEYFQSLEVVAGDIFNLEVHRTWEFSCENSTDKCIRNMAIPYMTIGVPLIVLKKVSALSERILGVSLLSANAILITTRLVYCCLSLLVDFSMYRLCKRHGKEWQNCLAVLGSSYICLIYAGRILSNSLETVLFAVLIDSVSQSLHPKVQPNASRNLSKLRKKTFQTKARLPNYFQSAKLSAILVIGIFNRPTFALFAVCPTLFWIIGPDRFHVDDIQRYLQRLASLLPGFLAFATIFCLTDTWYYDKLTFFTSYDKLIVTPWNFIKYNLDHDNLASHGSHSRWTHLIINEPLLFGPLSFSFMIVLELIYSSIDTSSVNVFMKCCFAVPILLLSAFSHQEPRFIMGLIFPLAFLNAEKLSRSRILTTGWIIFNIILSVFYGFLHQGGVVPSLNYIYKYHQNFPQHSKLNVFFFHTYMPPRFPLFNEKGNELVIDIHDLMGASTDVLFETMDRFQEGILVNPSSIRSEIQEKLESNFNLYLNTTLKFHLSMEDPPPLTHFVDYLGMDIQTMIKKQTNHAFKRGAEL